MAEPGLSLPFAPLAGTAETRRLRLVQVGVEDQAATMDQAAELIDALYDVSPCDTGTEGAGGEAADDSALPDEEDFLALAGKTLGELCGAQDHWDVRVDLLRSHPNPAAWRVQAGDAEHVSTEIVVETRTETVSLDGANHHDLEYPYHGGLAVAGAEVVNVRGSTVNFARPVTGRVRLTYTTRFERLTIRVPATPGPHGQAVAEPAAVVVFWDGRAAQLDLRQPEPDDGVSAAELERLCRGKGKDKDRPSGGCWERLAHYSLCRCTGAPAPDSEWEETAAATCPDGVQAGKYLGVRRVLDGYAGCPGEEEDVHDREFFKRTCCRYPYMHEVLPICRTIRRPYRGGAPIEGGADSWRERYGADVTLTAVSPEDGNCGEEITRWQVERKNCCDDIIPLSPSPDNPETFCAGETYDIGVRDGRPGDLRWELRGGLVFLDGTTSRITSSRSQRITTRQDVCPRPTVYVDDGCAPVTLTFSCDDAEAGGPTLSAENLYVAPDVDFSVSVGGGVPGYMWSAGGGLRVLGYSPDGATIYLRAGGRDEWCHETVSATDQCGRTATCDVHNSTGGWKEVPRADYDECSPPGTPYRMTEINVAAPHNGYRVQLARTMSQTVRAIDCTSPIPGVSCPAGNMIAYPDLGTDSDCRGAVRLGPMCCARYDASGNIRYSNRYTQRASRLWRWVC